MEQCGRKAVGGEKVPSRLMIAIFFKFKNLSIILYTYNCI